MTAPLHARLFSYSGGIHGRKLEPAAAGTANASQGLGAAPILEARVVGAASFGPPKFDAPDSLPLVQWRFDCKCWEAISGPRVVAY